MTDTKHYIRVRVASGRECHALRTGDTLQLLDAAPWDGGIPTGEAVAARDSTLLAPVSPRKILGIGKNYRAHAEEMGGEPPKEPLVFAKLPSSIIGPGEAVVLPPESARVDYEGELGIVIGRRARRVSRGEALSAVFGVTALCDVTARDFQLSDGQWTRAKSFDTFCPVGPEVVTGLDPDALSLELTVDGEVRQRGHTRDMVFDVPALVAYASSFCTLEPGDLIATGTPEGIGPLSSGNQVAVTIQGIEPLRFSVA